MIKLTRGEGEVIKGALEGVIELIKNGDKYDLAYDLASDLSCLMEELEDAQEIIEAVLDYREPEEII